MGNVLVSVKTWCFDIVSLFRYHGCGFKAVGYHWLQFVETKLDSSRSIDLVHDPITPPNVDNIRVGEENDGGRRSILCQPRYKGHELGETRGIP